MSLDIEGAARAAYEAAMTITGERPREPWKSLPTYWQRVYRVQAQAVADFLLPPPPPEAPVPAMDSLLDLLEEAE